MSSRCSNCWAYLTYSMESVSARTCCWTVLGCCHTSLVLLLVLCVASLYRQLHEVQDKVASDEAAVAELLEKVQHQQQGQIQDLTQKVEHEHSLTVLQMAGTFTLLTGLFTMFHMSSHLRHFYEPIVQRKIVAILWMSPIYGTTAFLSLVFPQADGYLAVVRDFYEAYVIYTFLSFLIAVLGRQAGNGSGGSTGKREYDSPYSQHSAPGIMYGNYRHYNRVDSSSDNDHHPSRNRLDSFGEPEGPTDARGRCDSSGDNSMDDDDVDNNSSHNNNNEIPRHGIQPAHPAAATTFPDPSTMPYRDDRNYPPTHYPPFGHQPQQQPPPPHYSMAPHHGYPPYPPPPPYSGMQPYGHPYPLPQPQPQHPNQPYHPYGPYYPQQGYHGYSNPYEYKGYQSNNDDETRRAVVQVLARHYQHLHEPRRFFDRFCKPLSPRETVAEHKANAVLTECQILAMQFVFVRPLTSIASFVAANLPQSQSTTAADSESGGDSNTWDYFKSPNFFIAMITNVSVFLAFNGLLKFYHAVRGDLQWCKPFSKFMAIKSIVFLTFWQGLLINIIVTLHYDSENFNHNEASSSAATATIMTSGSTAPGTTTMTTGGGGGALRWIAATATATPYGGSSNGGGTVYMASTSASSQADAGNNNDWSGKSPGQQAAEIQNILICLEMLFFSIAHWCVFPTEEWEPGYRPMRYAKPGIGIKDFVSDMSYIIQTRRKRRRSGRHHTGSSSNANHNNNNNHHKAKSFDPNTEEGMELQRRSADAATLPTHISTECMHEGDDVDNVDDNSIIHNHHATAVTDTRTTSPPQTSPSSQSQQQQQQDPPLGVMPSEDTAVSPNRLQNRSNDTPEAPSTIV